MGLNDNLNWQVIIKKHDGSATYFDYDAFAPPGSGARVIGGYVEDKLNETAPFEIRIEDSGDAIDGNIKSGNGFKILIKIGRSQATLENFVAGYIRKVDVERVETGIKEYVLHGMTNPIRNEERIVNVFRIAKRAANGEDPDMTDATVRADNLIKSVYEDIDNYPMGGPLLPFTTAGVQTVSEKLTTVRQPFVTIKEVVDRVEEATGAILGIDANDDVFFRYATLTHSGVTIRDSDPVGVVPDDTKTGYFVGPWKMSRSIFKREGFSNRLLGRGGTQLHMDIDKFTNNSQIEVHSLDRAIQFPAKAARLDNIALILSRIGTIPDDIKGEVVFDDADTPTGDIVGSFTIWKKLLNDVTEGQATTLNRVNLAMHGGRMQVGTKYWIILKKQGDASNHYRWHHDNGATARNATYDGATWTVNNNSYALTHRTYCSRRVIFTASDPASTNKYGIIEQPVDAPWILEPQTMDALLTGILQWSAKQKLFFEPKQIFGPTVPLHAGTLIRMTDALGDIDVDAELRKVAYKFDSNQNGKGTRWVDIEPIGFLA